MLTSLPAKQRATWPNTMLSSFYSENFHQVDLSMNEESFLKVIVGLCKKGGQNLAKMPFWTRWYAFTLWVIAHCLVYRGIEIAWNLLGERQSKMH